LDWWFCLKSCFIPLTVVEDDAFSVTFVIWIVLFDTYKAVATDSINDCFTFGVLIKSFLETPFNTWATSIWITVVDVGWFVGSFVGLIVG